MKQDSFIPFDFIERTDDEMYHRSDRGRAAACPNTRRALTTAAMHTSPLKRR